MYRARDHGECDGLTESCQRSHFGRDTLQPGDVYLVNDSYRGGGHLPDITLIRPAFSDASLANPFLNDRAVQYWDSQSLDRWMAMHDVRWEDPG